jgi:hypothetical protein
MFRFVLQVAFIRRLLEFRFVRYTLAVVFAGALIASFVYASVVFRALNERSNTPHVQQRSNQ